MTQGRFGFALVFGLLLAVAACGDDDDGPKGSIFPEKPECMGADVVAFAGEHQQVISTLAIGTKDDGFDLDGDGDLDNQLAGLGSLARGPIEDAFDEFSIIIPLEFFDFSTVAADSCVKFAFYLGQYQLDADMDGEVTAKENKDCNDHDAAIKPGAAEVAANGKDDDCDGLADESAEGTPSTDTADTDGDLVTLADGDCDDTNAMVKPGGLEICGDGLDNDCSRGADYSKDAMGKPVCTPFDATSPDTLPLDPLSFNTDGSPVIEFNSAETVMEEGKLRLHAGPSLFSVTVPITDGINLELRITGATIDAEVVETADGLTLAGGRLGGVLDANTLDTIRGLTIEQIGLLPEDSLLDAMFTNPTLMVILNLDKIDTDGDMTPDCSTPDIDVDQDGLEAFCDSNGDDEIYVVDTCIDGDGTVYHDGDMGSLHCTEITNADGTKKFVDGISVVLTFETVPAVLAE